MSWNTFRIMAIYDDGNETPINNAFVYIRFKNGNNIIVNEYVSGYTGSDGILVVNSTQETSNFEKILYRCIDETNFFQVGDKEENIVNNSRYIASFDIESNTGIHFYTYYEVLDGLYNAITNGDKLLSPKNLNIYTKNLNGTYTLYRRIDGINRIEFDDDFYTTDLRLEFYRTNGTELYTRNINYKNAMFGGGGGHFLPEDYYDLKLPLVNDTINWNDKNKTLINVDFDITLTYNSGATPPLTMSLQSSSDYTYLRADLSSHFNTAGAIPFRNLTNPSLNTIKASKNHYNEVECEISISAETSNGEFSNYVILLNGDTSFKPILLQRESNVCMTNKDLYDYIISLTGFRINTNNFNRFEEYDDNRVGTSKLSYFNAWISAITSYLPSEFQGRTASTVSEFKQIFVNHINSTWVSTKYTYNSYTEQQYDPNNNIWPFHGYVWDRCFIPQPEIT